MGSPGPGQVTALKKKAEQVTESQPVSSFLGVFNFSSGFHIAFLASLPDGLQPASQINPFLLCLLLIVFFFLIQVTNKANQDAFFCKRNL